MVLMRAFGSLYTFIVGISTLTDIFDDREWLVSYEIFDDIVFPIRDFFEALFFSYLFYYQSSRKKVISKTYDHYRYIGIKGLADEELQKEPTTRESQQPRPVSEFKGILDYSKQNHLSSEEHPPPRTDSCIEEKAPIKHTMTEPLTEHRLSS